MLRKTTEPDGHNIGKASVDDAGTAHGFLGAKEHATYGNHSERKRWTSHDYATYAVEQLQGGGGQ